MSVTTNCPHCGQQLGWLTIRSGSCDGCQKALSVSGDTWAPLEDEAAVWPCQPALASEVGGDLLPVRRIGHNVSEGEWDLIQSSPLDSGVSGVIYRAHQVGLNREVALKLLRQEKCASPRLRAQFLTEARVTAELDHPNIVPVYDFGLTQDGTPFYAMKLVTGRTWLSCMADRSLADNLETLLHVSDAIAYAHKRGVIHRDIKPENVLLGAFGEVFLMDWGLAAGITSTACAPLLAVRPLPAGTPPYMAPEMAVNNRGSIGFSADIYLLGAVLFEILTGVPPHPGEDREQVLQAAASNVLAEERSQSAALLAIATRAMATNPAKRFASAEDFRDAVREYERHRESILLTDHAKADQAGAMASRSYAEFGRALFAFQEALALWEQNEEAARGEANVRLAYATCALEQGDLDLAESLLIASDSDHANVLERIAQRRTLLAEEAAKNAARSVVIRALVALTVISLLAGFLVVRSHKKQALTALQKSHLREAALQDSKDRVHDLLRAAQQDAAAAQAARDSAVQQAVTDRSTREQAQSQRDRAIAEKTAADLARTNAEEASVQAELQRVQAVSARREAEDMLMEAQERLRKVQLVQQATLENHEALLAQDNESQQQRERLESELTIAQDALRKAETERDHAIRIQKQLELALDGLEPARATAQTGHQDLLTAQAEAKRLARMEKASKRRAAVADYAHSLQLARAHIREDALGDATRLLEAAPPSLRNWEWGQLMAKAKPAVTALRGHDAVISMLAMSPDSRSLVVADQSGAVVVWDLQAQAPTKIRQQHTAPVVAVRYVAPQLVVSVDEAGGWRQWESQSGTVIRDGRIQDTMRTLSLNGGGDNALLVLGERRLLAIDIASQLRLMRVETERDIGAAVLLPHALKAVVGTTDGALTWYEPSGERTDLSLRLPESPANVRWVTAPGSREAKRLSDHRAAITAIGVSTSGAMLATGDAKSNVRIWSVHGRAMHHFQGAGKAITALAFAARGKRLIGGDIAGILRIWDYEQKRDIVQLRVQKRAVNQLVASADGGVVAVPDGEQVNIWRVFESNHALQLQAHAGATLSAQVVNQGHTILTTGADGSAALWNARDGKLERRFNAHRGAAYGAFLDRNGTRLMTAGLDRIVQIWDARNGGLVKSASHPDRTICLLTVGPDGQSVEVSRGKRGLRTRSLVPGESALLLPQRTLHASDGSLSVSAAGGMVTIWDTVTQDQLASSQFAESTVQTLTFSPDNKRLLVGTDGGELVVLDPRSGVRLVGLDAQASGITCANFSADGRQLVVGTADGTVHLWHSADWRKP